MIELDRIAAYVLSALVEVDSSHIPFKSFLPGVGPYGEPQLVKHICKHFQNVSSVGRSAVTKRSPDLLIANQWALEFKIVRPYGDNGREAENWSVNLLHPYPGSTSSIGDCLKLLSLPGPERKAVIVIGYEHSPPKIDLTPLIQAFELVAHSIGDVQLGERIEVRHAGLIHPVHQVVRVFAWEVRERATCQNL